MRVDTMSRGYQRRRQIAQLYRRNVQNQLERRGMTMADLGRLFTGDDTLSTSDASANALSRVGAKKCPILETVEWHASLIGCSVFDLLPWSQPTMTEDHLRDTGSFVLSAAMEDVKNQLTELHEQDVRRLHIDVERGAAERVSEVEKDSPRAAAYPLGCSTPQHAELILRARELLGTQDNHITAHPMFVVQQKRRFYGMNLGYCDDVVWLDVHCDFVEVTDPAEVVRLNSQWDENHCVPDGYRRTGYHDVWEFVTACFTEQGCRDYLVLNGHNLGKTRIYVESAYRNNEWQAVRDLLSLPSEEGPRCP